MTDGDDFVASPSDDEIIRSIRDRYIRDASLAIVLLGESTWSRRFVDWEIAAALDDSNGNPLSLVAFDIASGAQLPPRLSPGANELTTIHGSMPTSAAKLADDIRTIADSTPPRSNPSPLVRADLLT